MDGVLRAGVPEPCLIIVVRDVPKESQNMELSCFKQQKIN